MTRPKSETISFRLNIEVCKLVDRSRKPFSLSRGEWVRGIVTNHLQNDSLEALAKETIELRQEISQQRFVSESLNDSIRRLAFLILTQGDPCAPEVAKEQVRKLFRQNQQ